MLRGFESLTYLQIKDFTMLVLMLFLTGVAGGCLCDGISYYRENRIGESIFYFMIAGVAGFYSLKFWIWAIFY